MVVDPNRSICLSDEVLFSIVACEAPVAQFDVYMGHLKCCEKCVDRALEIEARGEFKWLEMVKVAAANLRAKEMSQGPFPASLGNYSN